MLAQLVLQMDVVVISPQQQYAVASPQVVAIQPQFAAPQQQQQQQVLPGYAHVGQSQPQPHLQAQQGTKLLRCVACGSMMQTPPGAYTGAQLACPTCRAVVVVS